MFKIFEFRVYNIDMKSLRQSLIDYEPSLLQAIADCRAVPLTGSNKMEIIVELIEALLSPVASAIVLDDLSEAESAALNYVLAHGGLVEAARFGRQFGVVRPMGVSRLERERPWQSPANAAEGLWYRGLIYKAFLVTDMGGQEMVYVPTDLRPLLAPAGAQPVNNPPFQIDPVGPPAHIFPGVGRLRENVFSLLVYLQIYPVRLQAHGRLSTGDRQALLDALLPPDLPHLSPGDELDFLLHLSQRADLIETGHGRLRLNRAAVRDWLQADAAPQAFMLQNAWRADPTWNDLWRVPGLAPQATGWENSPLLARSKILDHLAQIGGAPESWFSIDDFVAAIKRADPDFQRPNGDYESWYIQDEQGQSLMGFKHWDRVEGELIRYVLGCLLPTLNVVEVGAADSTAAPRYFRVTAAGKAFLAGQPTPAESPARPVYLRLDEKFRVRVPAQCSLYDRFQLARIATLEQREPHRALYQITRASISRALKNGVTPDQITAFLTRVTNNQTPLKVVETLRAWGTRFGTVKLEQATLLRVETGQQLIELRQHPALRTLLGEVVGPTVVLVPAQNMPKVRQILIDLGYLE